MELQLQSNIDWITVPEINGNAAEWEKLIVKEREYITLAAATMNRKVEVLPALSLAMPESDFRKRLQIILDNGFSMFNPLYAPMKYFPNYFYLRNTLRDKDVWAHISDIPRTWPLNWKSSTPHILQFFGANSFAIRMPPKFPFVEGQETVFDINTFRARRFDQRTLGNIRTKEHLDRYGDDMNCTPLCPVCAERKNFVDFCTHYGRRKLLPMLFNIHETFGSHRELKEGSKFALVNDVKSYVNDREYLKDGAISIIRQKGLSNYFQ